MTEAGFRGNPERTECCAVLVGEPCRPWCENATEEPMKAATTELISVGPGHVDRRDAPYGLAADVSLDLDYHNMAPSDTRAILHLKAINIEEGVASVDIGIELTEGDLRLVVDKMIAMLFAIKEDDSGG